MHSVGAGFVRGMRDVSPPTVDLQAAYSATLLHLQCSGTASHFIPLWV